MTPSDPRPVYHIKAWFPYRCICRICRVCRTKKVHRTATTLWKPPVQMLNTKETTDTTFCTRWNELYLSYEFFSFDRHDRYDRYNDMETRLKRAQVTSYLNRPLKLVCLFSHFRPRDTTRGNSFFQMSSYARANVRITNEKNKRKIPMRASRGLKSQNKMYRLKRSIALCWFRFTEKKETSFLDIIHIWR